MLNYPAEGEQLSPFITRRGQRVACTECPLKRSATHPNNGILTRKL